MTRLEEDENIRDEAVDRKVWNQKSECFNNKEDKQEPSDDSRSLMAVVGRSRLGNGGRYCKHTWSRDDGPHWHWSSQRQTTFYSLHSHVMTAPTDTDQVNGIQQSIYPAHVSVLVLSLVYFNTDSNVFKTLNWKIPTMLV